LGKGKYAAIEKENTKLKAENERIRKAFPEAVKKEVEKQTKALTEEKQKAEAERDRQRRDGNCNQKSRKKRCNH